MSASYRAVSWATISKCRDNPRSTKLHSLHFFQCIGHPQRKRNVTCHNKSSWNHWAVTVLLMGTRGDLGIKRYAMASQPTMTRSCTFGCFTVAAELYLSSSLCYTCTRSSSKPVQIEQTTANKSAVVDDDARGNKNLQLKFLENCPLGF
ncbi:hypothetical protein TNIN_5181 [Trichonephila inaurata madagascariensis]|uniref:Uncharacterized protein n=1 Tax=Trichonephila inaurata madagascariensis TaxID=2747483 RepID=A0A8X7C8X7_9ARAC|nr:hypothetical protein TNIN_5181 [Trichonephila inaurata madagascariensis]